MGDSAHEPGQYPEVHDEAGPTPSWVPLTGLGLVALLLMVFAYYSATAEDEPETIEAPAAVEGAPPEAPPAPTLDNAPE